MNLEKVIFAFTIVLAASINFGFFLGEIDNPFHHHVYGLYAAIFFNTVAAILKFGDRSHIGAVLLACSAVAVLQLAGAAVIWGYAVYVSGEGVAKGAIVSIVSLSGGAMLANIFSLVLLMIEVVLLRR